MIFDPIMSLINGLRTKVGNATLTTTAQDLSGGVNELNDQKANESTVARVYNDATAPAGGIPANSFYYHNGVLYYTANLIAQGTTLPQGTASTSGGLNTLAVEHTFHFKRKEVPTNGTVTFNIADYSTGIFLVAGYTQAFFGIYMLSINPNTGGLINRVIAESSNTTITASGNTVTFSNGSSVSKYILYMTMSGIPIS